MLPQRVNWLMFVVGTIALAATTVNTATAQIFFSEDFESATLGAPVDETVPEDMPVDQAWSATGQRDGTSTAPMFPKVV